MKKTRVGLVFRRAPSNWDSLNTIKHNLRMAWKAAPRTSILEFPYGPERDWTAWARRIENEKLDALAFIDSSPVPFEPLVALDRLGLSQKLNYYIHVCGAFSINTHYWSRLSFFLEGRKIAWIASSRAQVGQLQALMLPSTDVRQIPFPVDPKVFFPRRNSSQNRIRPFRFLYVGRISYQKNTDQLLDWMIQFLRSRQDVEMLFAGGVDDIGSPLFGYRPSKGSNLRNWNHNLDVARKTLGTQVQYLGYLSSQQVARLATKVDCCISLSTYHDEDFGMAPLESLFCGARALLSRWGGYADFDLGDGSVSLLRINARKGKLALSKSEFFRELNKIAARGNVNWTERRARHQRYEKKFGVSSIGHQLKEALSQDPLTFPGFSPALYEHEKKLSEYWKNKKPLYRGLKDPLYKKLYVPYFGRDLDF